MKAIVHDRYGSPEVLRLEEVPEPEPGDEEVLVRVAAASVNPYDWHFMRGLPYAMRLEGMALRSPRNRILGSDLAGRVEAVGPGVAGFAPGDEVYASIGSGAFAERALAPAEKLAPKPASLSFVQAAAAPMAGLTALTGLCDVGRLQAGQSVLVIGAGGGVGTFAVQIAAAIGAEVTGVCGPGKAELVRSLGASRVIDYTLGDPLPGGERYDLVFQLAGTARPSSLRRALTPEGTLLVSSGESPGRVIGPLGRSAQAVLLSRFVGQRLVPFLARLGGEELRGLTEVIEAGRASPVVDRTYPLREAATAIGHLEDGHARGKLVLEA